MHTLTTFLIVLLAVPVAAAADFQDVFKQLAPLRQTWLGAHSKTAPLSAKQDDISDAEDFVFFADFVIGAGWSFQLAVNNNSPTTRLEGRMAITVNEDHEAAMSWEGVVESGLAPRFSIPPGGTRIYSEWPNIPPGAVVRGGLVLLQFNDFPAFENDARMMSAVLTYRHDESGIEVTVPPLGVRELTPPFFNDELAYSIFVEETADVTTGLAVWKSPGNAICMGLHDLRGALFEDAEQRYTLWCYGRGFGGNWSHGAAMLPQWFPGWDFSEGFQGRLVVFVVDDTFGRLNDGLVIPMGLRVNRNSGAISAVPVVSVPTDLALDKTGNRVRPAK